MNHDNYPELPGFKEHGGTSEQAAKEIKIRAATIRLRIMDLFDAIPRTQGLTADEISDAIREPLCSVRPRCTELKLSKEIYKTTETRRNAMGKSVRVWKKVTAEPH